jgi:cephalosporin-C deacetylase-like acetyl esterase
MDNKKMIIGSLTLIFLFNTLLSVAQVTEQLVMVQITPKKKEWNYNIGDNVSFEIEITKNRFPLEDVPLRYELSYDMMSPFKKGEATLKDGKMQLEAGTMNEPGFMRCLVYASYKGKEYEGRATVGFEPEKIEPVTVMPGDFKKFWDDAICYNARLPLNLQMRFLPEKSTAKANVYEINFQNYHEGGRMFGILCIPKKPGKYPALLRLPGAGIRPYSGHVPGAENGYITLDLGIHGIPVTMDNMIYENLGKGALHNYQYTGWENRDKVYYKRVYLGCVRAVDAIFSLPEFDGENLVVQGGSQGGALSIVTGALDKRVKAVIALFPALSDLTGVLKGRASGWPAIFSDREEPESLLQLKAENTQYYDVVNFARFLTVPAFLSFGYNDMVCPPTSMFAAYNVISSPKKLMVVPETAHYAFPEQWNSSWRWWLDIKND